MQQMQTPEQIQPPEQMQTPEQMQYRDTDKLETAGSKPPPTPMKKAHPRKVYSELPSKRPRNNYIGHLDKGGKFINVSGNTPKLIDFTSIGGTTIDVVVNELPVSIYIRNVDPEPWKSISQSYLAKVWLSERDAFECEVSTCTVNPFDKLFKTVQATVRLVNIDLKTTVENYLASKLNSQQYPKLFSGASQPVVATLDEQLPPRTDLKPFELASSSFGSGSK